jgi:hypothetical protein
VKLSEVGEAVMAVALTTKVTVTICETAPAAEMVTVPV